MRFRFSIVVVLGFISTRRFILCQPQETFNPGDSSVGKLASLEREIAKFETQQSQGHADAHIGNDRGHGGHHQDPQNGQTHAPAHAADHHTHNIDIIHAPSAGNVGHITDIHGNRPPHPGGLHVDLPNEHGNKELVPVLHHGSDPFSSNHPVGRAPPHVGGIPEIVGPPALNDLTMSKGLSIPDGIHSVSNPLDVQITPLPSGHETGQVDPGLSFPNGIFSGKGVSILDGFSSSPSQHMHGGPGHLGTHVDGPNEHGNTLPIAVIHRPNNPSHTVGIKHAGTHIDGPVENGVILHGHGQNSHVGPAPHGTHVDGPNEHGNNLPFPVIHRPHVPNVPAGPEPHGTHVDGPNEHGNNLPFPVIHRPHGPNVPVGPAPHGTHVDGPNEHGNNLPFPVIHRPHGPNVPVGPAPHGTHVDGPNEHGNNLPFPVIHRPHGPNVPAGPEPHGTHVDGPNEHGNNLPFPVIHRPHGPNVPAGPEPHGTHVDGPNEHGNNLPFPVIHRPHGPNVPAGPEPHGTHVDGPNEHGNNLPFPVIHRPHGPNVPAGPEPHGTHVDGPNEHGNNLPFPVIHRPHGPNVPAGPEPHGTHVDGPNEHGNNLPFPVIHRPHGPNVPAGPAPHGTHVDGPNEHGNNLPFPVIHRPHGPNIIASATHPVNLPPHEPNHPGGSPHHGTHVDGPNEHGNTLPFPVIHRQHGPNQPGNSLHQGTHVDGPNEHGNTLPVAVIHRPQPPNHPVIIKHAGTHVGGPNEGGHHLPVPDIHVSHNQGGSISPGHQKPFDLLGPHIPTVHHSPGSDHLASPRALNTHIDPHVPIGGLHPMPFDQPPSLAHSLPGVLEPKSPVKDHFATGVGHTPDGLPIAYPFSPAVLHGSPDHIHKEPTARLAIYTGVPTGALNIPIVPDRRRRRRNRRLRRLQRLRERALRKDSLLSDVLKASEIVTGKNHKHKPSPKAPKGVVVVRRQRPAASGILGGLLGSLISGGGLGPRPIRLRLGRPPQDPLQAVGSHLIGMLVNRIASG